MRKLCTACLVTLSLLSSCVFAQRPRGMEEENPASFRCQAGQRLSTSADSARVFVAYSFPYDNLVFVRDDAGGFAASIESSVSLFDEEKVLEGERTTTTTVRTNDFKQTNSRTMNAVHSEEFFVAPGKYEVFVVLLDRESKRK
ncbi:hypothetical protein IT157_03285, partial [bacterium]|nr:hypothetical protein [bacterium]